MNVAVGLIAARLLHYTALTALFGATLFPLYAFSAGTAPGWLAETLRRTALIAAAIALLSGILWLGCTIAQMSGEPAGIFDAGILSTVIGNTQFGRVWIWRLLGLALLLPLFLPRSASAWLNGARIAVSALLLASLAAVGHAATGEGGGSIVHAVSDAAHLVAAGLWLGGLIPLAAGLALAERQAQESVLLRFSRVASVAVAVLGLSGLVNTWFLVGSVEGLFGTDYGRLLLFKLALFAAMLFFACMNCFRLVPRLARAQDSNAVTQLHRNVLIEQSLGLLALASVSVLGTLAPAIQN